MNMIKESDLIVTLEKLYKFHSEKVDEYYLLSTKNKDNRIYRNQYMWHAGIVFQISQTISYINDFKVTE